MTRRPTREGSPLQRAAQALGLTGCAMGTFLAAPACGPDPQPPQAQWPRIRVVHELQPQPQPSALQPSSRWFVPEPDLPSEMDRYCCVRGRFPGQRRAQLQRDPAAMTAFRIEVASMRAYELQFCCDAWSGRSATGQLSVRLHIDAYGDVVRTQVHVAPPEAASESLVACASRLVSSWRFLSGREPSVAEAQHQCFERDESAPIHATLRR